MIRLFLTRKWAYFAKEKKMFKINQEFFFLRKIMVPGVQKKYFFKSHN